MRERILRIGSARELTAYASEDLQNDIARERDLDALKKKIKTSGAQAKGKKMNQKFNIYAPNWFCALRGLKKIFFKTTEVLT
ncbi:MAG: hypothetical protein M1511_18140 [Deltaproteobacteria bacterium]|nr:hypothetical protein [Deltaproteobacteria bacterium]